MNDDDGWLNGGMPFIDHIFPNGKTGREIALENLKQWAADRAFEERTRQEMWADMEAGTFSLDDIS